MNNFIIYLIQSSIVLSVFQLFYMLLLKKEASFRLNRYILLSGIFASLLLPFLKFNLSNNSELYHTITLSAIEVGSGKDFLYKNIAVLSFTDYLLLFYILIIIILAIIGFVKVKQLIKINKHAEVEIKNGYKYCKINQNISPFSFMNAIYYNPEKYDSAELNNIFAHEKAHINQKHSIDSLLADIMCIMHWFNPLVWFMRKSIKETHEYLADQEVLKQGFSIDQYQLLLVQQSVGFQFGFTNNFNKSLTLKRLKKMKQKKSIFMTTMKTLVLIPVMALLVLLFNGTINKTIAQNTDVVKIKKEEKTYHIVEEMPEFPGGGKKLRMYIAKNIKYPEDAKKAKKAGTVYVMFVVTKTGTVENAKVIRGVYPSIDKEALRVVRSLPEFEPGKQDGKPVRVQFTIPIQFALK